VKKIDKIDSEICSYLFKDGREKYTEIGMKLKTIKGSKLSHVSVQKRIQKLIDNSLMKIQANVNVAKMGLISAFIMIETMDFAAQRRIIERFRLCPRVVMMDLVSGKYNIIMRAMAPNLKDLECFLNCSRIKNEQIRDLEIYISSTNVKPKFIPIPTISFEDRKDNAPCGTRCVFCDLYKTKECSGCPATKYPLEVQKQET
jgi:DNA-binding Lrp family transcriptional regulator